MPRNRDRTCARDGCKNRFTPTRRTNIYCSRDCSRKAANALAPTTFEPKECERPGCGVVFTPGRKNARYCSPSCSRRMQNARQVIRRQGQQPDELRDADLIDLAERRGYVIHKPAPALEPVIFDTARIRGDRVRVAFVSDTHIGSKYQQVSYLREFMRYAEREAKVDCFIHGGDVVDGPIEAHRGAVHEMWTGTYDGQRAAAIEQLPETKLPVKVIRGNHDEFYLKNAGGDIVGDICKERGFDYVGTSSSGALIQYGDVRVLVQHPHDGMSYALSYKLQRRIEALAPENRPHILALGNYHKAAHLPAYRNTEGFILPAFQSQSAWMASKGLASIVGGLIVEFGISAKGLAPSFKTEWVLYREPLSNDWPAAA